MYKGDPDATGTLTIYVDHPACDSCMGVKEQFEQMFPGIDVYIEFVP